MHVHAVLGEPEEVRVVRRSPGRGRWLRAERSATLHARPGACIATLLEFERLPEWQQHVTSVSVDERDRRVAASA